MAENKALLLSCHSCRFSNFLRLYLLDALMPIFITIRARTPFIYLFLKSEIPFRAPNFGPTDSPPSPVPLRSAKVGQDLSDTAVRKFTVGCCCGCCCFLPPTGILYHVLLYTTSKLPGHSWANRIAALRSVTKLATTYLTAWEETWLPDPWTECVHKGEGGRGGDGHKRWQECPGGKPFWKGGTIHPLLDPASLDSGGQDIPPLCSKDTNSWLLSGVQCCGRSPFFEAALLANPSLSFLPLDILAERMWLDSPLGRLSLAV